jgi:hypothetical protein
MILVFLAAVFKAKSKQVNVGRLFSVDAPRFNCLRQVFINPVRGLMVNAGVSLFKGSFEFFRDFILKKS